MPFRKIKYRFIPGQNIFYEARLFVFISLVYTFILEYRDIPTSHFFGIIVSLREVYMKNKYVPINVKHM